MNCLASVRESSKQKGKEVQYRCSFRTGGSSLAAKLAATLQSGHARRDYVLGELRSTSNFVSISISHVILRTPSCHRWNRWAHPPCQHPPLHEDGQSRTPGVSPGRMLRSDPVDLRKHEGGQETTRMNVFLGWHSRPDLASPFAECYCNCIRRFSRKYQYEELTGG